MLNHHFGEPPPWETPPPCASKAEEAIPHLHSSFLPSRRVTTAAPSPPPRVAAAGPPPVASSIPAWLRVSPIAACSPCACYLTAMPPHEPHLHEPICRCRHWSPHRRRSVFLTPPSSLMGSLSPRGPVLPTGRPSLASAHRCCHRSQTSLSRPLLPSLCDRRKSNGNGLIWL